MRKLSAGEAAEARVMRAAFGYTLGELAELYGVAETTMWSLIRGLTYAEADGPVEDASPVTAGHGTSMYTRGCRCDVCTGEHKVACRKWRERRK